MKFITGLPPSDGNTTILTMVDPLSKIIHFIPPGKGGWNAADLLGHCVFQLHGFLKDIMSDWGPQFTSLVWRSFHGVLRASFNLPSGNHPQSNGQVARGNQGLESPLWCVTAQHPAPWSSFLSWIEYPHNLLISAATWMSPLWLPWDIINHFLNSRRM